MRDLLRRVLPLLRMNSRLCLIEISSNKTRSFISSFGIFLGVTTLLILLSLVRSMNKEVEKSVIQMGGIDILTVKAIDAETRDEAVAFRRSPGLRLSQIDRIIAETPILSDALPQLEAGHLDVVAGQKEAHARPLAVTLPYFSAYKVELGSGRAFTRDEDVRGARVCVIGSRLADRLFGKGVDPVGRTLVMKQIPLKVVGLIRTQDNFDRRAGLLLFPLALHFERISGPDPRMAEIAIRIRDVARLSEAQTAITGRLLTLHRGVEDFEVSLNEEKINELRRTTAALDILLIILSTLSLFIGGVSITNVMFATIGERIREIGVRKALGARRSDLFVQFLTESVLLSLTGALPGLLAGSIPVLLPADLLPMDPTLFARDYALALGFTLGIGIAAGFFPALKAANMKPVEALQYV